MVPEPLTSEMGRRAPRWSTGRDRDLEKGSGSMSPRHVPTRLVVMRSPATFGDLGHSLRISDASLGSFSAEELWGVQLGQTEGPKVMDVQPGAYRMEAKYTGLGCYFNSNALYLNIGEGETVFVLDETCGLLRQTLGLMGGCFLGNLCKPIRLVQMGRTDFHKSLQLITVGDTRRWRRLTCAWVFLALLWLGGALVIVGAPLWKSIIVERTQRPQDVPLALAYILANLFLALSIAGYAALRRCRVPLPTSEILVSYEDDE